MFVHLVAGRSNKGERLRGEFLPSNPGAKRCLTECCVLLTQIVLSTVDIQPSELARAAVAAEQAGFHTAFVYDHVSGATFDGSTVTDVWVSLAAMALATTTIGLGPLVVNTSVRHPAHINTAVASLQDLSGGRLVLGLGAGSGPDSKFGDEFTNLGTLLAGAVDRRAKLVDTITSLRRIWSVANPGSRSTANDEPHEASLGMAIPSEIPRIIVGSNGPRVAAIAGQYADEMNVHYWERDIPGLLDAARQAAKEAGRTTPPAFSVETPYTDEWLDPASASRQQLSDYGVERVQLQWNSAIGIDAIIQAERRLRG